MIKKILNIFIILTIILFYGLVFKLIIDSDKDYRDSENQKGNIISGIIFLK